MRVSDLLEIEDLHERLQRMSGRLVPLCQGDALYQRPQPVQSFFALMLLRGELRNGSLHQYFSNSAGDTWRLAKVALEALGEAELHRIFSEALRAFPGSEPSTDRGKRYHQLADVDVHTLFDLGTQLMSHEPALLAAMARQMDANRAAFQFLDRYPNGFKALPLPTTIDLTEYSLDEPFVLITAAFAALHDKGGARGPIEQRFFDVFALADEVSVAGFRSYFFTRAADRHIDALVALRGLNQAEVARLLDQAIALVPGTLSDETIARRVQLKALKEDGLEALDQLSRSFQAHRSTLARELAKYVAAHLTVFAA